MEEDLYNRIGEADLNPTYKDGQVYQHTDVNNMLSILKLAINENYYDIQRLWNGERTVGNADQLDGATLSRYLNEELQADDNKVPSSQQVMSYINALFEDFSSPIRGVDYWTEEDKLYIIDETANRIIDELKGDYDADTTYEKLNIVFYQGSTYFALQQTTGNLPTNTTYWQLLAKRGDSAYELYRKHGGTLTEDVWLDEFTNAENFYNKSEVDNKLSLRDLLINQKPYYFDTVADMKAYDLNVGDYVITKGYYQANDGGEGAYYIVNNHTLTDDGGSVHDLSNGLKAILLIKNSINVKVFGVKGDGINDDSDALEYALNYCANNGIKAIIKNCVCSVNRNLTISYPEKDILIDGNDSIIKIVSTGGRYRTLNINCKNIAIKNLKFDGSTTPQDEFDETDWNNLTTNCALNLSAKNIKLNNLLLSNWYGSGIRVYDMENVVIDNVIIDNVGGHWYLNDTHDAFGDAITVAGFNGKANININNVNATGKYKNNTLSRIGIAMDYSRNKNDELTLLNISNCNFINYDRGIHVENINGKALINYNNGKIVSNVFLLNYGNQTEQVQITGNNLLLDYHDGAYNGSYGIYNSIFNINNSTINCQTKSIGMFKATGKYNNCIINNNTNKVFTDFSGIIEINKSTFNIENLTSYLNYRSIININDSIFNSSVPTTEARTASAINYKNCTFNNFFPMSKALDLNNKIYATNYEFTNDNLWAYKEFYLYNDNNLISEPNISKTFPVNNINLYNYINYRDIRDGELYDFIPSFENTTLRPNTKYILISIASTGNAVMRDGKNFKNYYINTLTTDENKIVNIGTTQIVGNPSSGGFNLNIDESNNKVSKAGNYAYILVQWLLPYYFKDYLANFS